MRIPAPLLFTVLGAALLAACALPGPRQASNDLPANATPHLKVAPLAFLSGRWLSVNPNDTVNEEHWMPPRGRFLIGTFRQIRLDGRCAFVELSQISLDESGEVVLRLRHLHRELEVPEPRKAVDVFRLHELSENRVEFTGTGSADAVTSVVYELRGPNELVQTLTFDPKKTENKPFVSVYRRATD